MSSVPHQNESSNIIRPPCVVTVTNDYSDSSFLSKETKSLSKYLLSIHKSHSLLYHILVYFSLNINISIFCYNTYQNSLGVLQCVVIFLISAGIIYTFQFSLITLIQVIEEKNENFVNFIAKQFGSITSYFFSFLLVLWSGFLILLFLVPYRTLFLFFFSSRNEIIEFITYCCTFVFIFCVIILPKNNIFQMITLYANWISNAALLIIISLFFFIEYQPEEKKEPSFFNYFDYINHVSFSLNNIVALWSVTHYYSKLYNNKLKLQFSLLGNALVISYHIASFFLFKFDIFTLLQDNSPLIHILLFCFLCLQQITYLSNHLIIIRRWLNSPSKKTNSLLCIMYIAGICIVLLASYCKLPHIEELIILINGSVGVMLFYIFPMILFIKLYDFSFATCYNILRGGIFFIFVIVILSSFYCKLLTL